MKKTGVVTSIFIFCMSCVISTGLAALKEHGLHAKFTQKRYLKNMERPLVSRGNLLVLPEYGLVWRVIEPFPNTLILSKSGIYQLEEGEAEAQKVNAESQIFNLLSRVLSGNLSKIEGFEKRAENSNEEGIQHTKLFPTSPQVKRFLENISLKIKGELFILEVRLQRPSGDYDILVFRDHKHLNDREREKFLNEDEKRLLYGQ